MWGAFVFAFFEEGHLGLQVAVVQFIDVTSRILPTQTEDVGAEKLKTFSSLGFNPRDLIYADDF